MTDWMGRYRELVAAIVQHTNVVSKSNTMRRCFYEGIYMNSNEWQVMEYIIEHRDDDEKMTRMSETLGIPQSSFSKIVKSLVTMGLVERFRNVDNKKDIILKPTALAVKVYEFHADQSYRETFKPFFDALEGISDEDLETVAKAITLLSGHITEDAEQQPEKKPLIKIE